MILGVMFILIVLLIVEIYFETNFTELKEVTIETEKSLGDKGIKMLQITDYHNFKQNNRVLKLAQTAKADLIVITGDLIDRKTKDFNNVYSFIKALVKINPNIYYVLGNHEWKNEGTKQLTTELTKTGVTIFSNENIILELRGQKFNLCGVDYEFSKNKDINNIMKDVDTDIYTVLLCHRPGIAKEYKNINVDLIISGHTHGGQIRLPFIGAILSSGGQLLPKYNKGLYKIFKNTLLYIDSGAGTTRLPIRFLNRSQISSIIISSSGKK